MSEQFCIGNNDYNSVKYDVLIIGCGHAGIEAANAASSFARTAIIVVNNYDIGKLSCNPAIGGIAKSHLVCEISSLGGVIGKLTDKSAIHVNVLNRSKGRAVRSLRVQVDRLFYNQASAKALVNTKIINDEVIELNYKNNYINVLLISGTRLNVKTVVIATGTFCCATCHIGECVLGAGRLLDQRNNAMIKLFRKYGIKTKRFKTGTPPRINKQSIKWQYTQRIISESVSYGFNQLLSSQLKTNICCRIVYTNPETNKLLMMYNKTSSSRLGVLLGLGPKYCLSIEDKISRLNKCQRFVLEPEGIDSDNVYLNGAFTSLPIEIQLTMAKTLDAFKTVTFAKMGYAVEYDVVNADEITNTLQLKRLENVFTAGQINGTTGYEEAAAQGWLAGTNASRQSKHKIAYKLNKLFSYIGLLAYDINTSPIRGPYRALTSRAITRNVLRQRNSILRLLPNVLSTFALTDSKEAKKLLWANYIKIFKLSAYILNKHIITINKFYLYNHRMLTKNVSAILCEKKYKHILNYSQLMSKQI
ncbi:MAG: FAD-dependent oxidoreductase [Candidatus Hodgkinia cicadicola]